uniref:small monomeric GTPase n=1 Tax=Gallus gallus TaxID=9031 RepID=A0A8V0Z2D2_CHICK
MPAIVSLQICCGGQCRQRDGTRVAGDACPVRPRAAACLTRSLAATRAEGAALASSCLIHWEQHWGRCSPAPLCPPHTQHPSDRGHLYLRGAGGPAACAAEGDGYSRPGEDRAAPVPQWHGTMLTRSSHPQDSPVNCERYLHWANAFLVVYSIDDRRSFEGCGRYLDILARHARGCQRQSPVLLLGNKLDMEQYRQVTKAEGMSLATKFGCLFYEVSACQDFAAVQHVFHQAVRELRREAERSPALRPLFIAEEQPCLAMATRHGLASCTINTLSTVNLKEIPSVAQAKLVTVKSSRAQSKRKAPTLTLLKGFKIF